MSIKDSLKKKIGPLPAWAWIAIIAGAVVLYAYYKNKKNAQAANASATPADVQPPVVNQFQMTPPVQEDEDEGKERHRPPGRHHRRKHPTDHDRRHDRDDGHGKTGGPPPVRDPRADHSRDPRARVTH